MGEQNATIKELAGRVPIRAYVSYRQKNPENQEAIQLLEKQCATHQIDLIYDKKELENGDSIKAFMNEISAARCVYILLTPAYFESSYTLYELIAIHKWAVLDKRFVFPIRVTEQVTAYSWTAMKQYWENNEAVRNGLADLLNLASHDHETAWQAVDNAWKEILSPCLDKLKPSLENTDKATLLNQLGESTYAAIAAAIQLEREKLHIKVKSEIAQILKSNLIALDKLAAELELTNYDVDHVATTLVTQNDAIDSIARLTQVIESQKNILKGTPQWPECHFNAERLGGWLLLNSIDNVWWFNHQLQWQQSCHESFRTIELNHQPYIEVIVSRELLQCARYRRNEKGKVQPYSDIDRENMELVFDPDLAAQEKKFLQDIYRDLYKPVVIPEEIQELQDSIALQLDSVVRVRKGKPIYYLVSRNTMDGINAIPWFSDWSRQLDGKLQFIAIDTKTNKPSPCANPASLLNQFGYLLSLR